MILILNVIVLLCIIAILIKLPVNKRVTPARITLLFTIAGALGNIVDRVRLGYVVDMLSFDLINFPVFNVADIFVTVSIFIFAVLYLFYYKDNEFDYYLFPKKTEAEEQKSEAEEVVLEEVNLDDTNASEEEKLENDDTDASDSGTVTENTSKTETVEEVTEAEAPVVESEVTENESNEK